MSEAGRVSVIVVSRGRPHHLRRCLKALAQSDHPRIEVIVVADPAGIASCAGLPVKSVAFDAANIAAARNLGIAAAAAEIVAFIDDDAVPEPTWLSRLVAPIAASCADVATGYVVGRNGITLQWGAERIDALGQSHAFDTSGETVSIVASPASDGAIKAVGTNSAFRRSRFVAAGGFDPAFRFYLDDSDLSLRLAADGVVTAVVPAARVHHGYAPSERRRRDRVPRDLHEIGASAAVFLRKHAASHMESGLALLRQRERVRVLRHMVSGGLEPRDVGRLMQGLERGIIDGLARPLAMMPSFAADAPPFLEFPSGPRPAKVLSGRAWQARRLRRQATDEVRAGAIVVVQLFSPTALYHHLRFCDAGYWEQRGGLFGRAERTEPLWRLVSFANRARQERRRLGFLIDATSPAPENRAADG